MKDKTIIGLYEDVTVFGNHNHKQTVKARIDTGATKSSIDVKLAAELKLGPVTKTKMVKSAQGSTLRPVVDGEVQISGQRIKCTFTIADRGHMKYSVLIGQDILKEGNFLIDPKKE